MIYCFNAHRLRTPRTTAQQRQKAVYAYFTSEQILHFGFAWVISMDIYLHAKLYPLRNQKEVTTHLENLQLLPFAYARQFCLCSGA